MNSLPFLQHVSTLKYFVLSFPFHSREIWPFSCKTKYFKIIIFPYPKLFISLPSSPRKHFHLCNHFPPANLLDLHSETILCNSKWRHFLNKNQTCFYISLKHLSYVNTLCKHPLRKAEMSFSQNWRSREYLHLHMETLSSLAFAQLVLSNSTQIT